MSRLSAIGRFSRWRSIVWRSPEAADSLVLDTNNHFILQTTPSTPTYSPPSQADASVMLGRRAFESFHPFSCFRSLSVFERDNNSRVLCLRQYSTGNERNDTALEEEMERKIGWLLKAFFLVTAFGVASHFYPFMGESLLQQSISLLHVKDPLFKRMGASRLSRFAVDDERRMKVVEMGGAQDLLIMLEGAKDDKTRKAALKALLVLSHSDAVANLLQQAGASVLVASAPDSLEYVEIDNYKSTLLNRLREFEQNQSLSEVAASEF